MPITKADLIELIVEGPEGPVSLEQVTDTGCYSCTRADPFGEVIVSFREGYHLVLENRTARVMHKIYKKRLAEVKASNK